MTDNQLVHVVISAVLIPVATFVLFALVTTGFPTLNVEATAVISFVVVVLFEAYNFYENWNKWV